MGKATKGEKVKGVCVKGVGKGGGSQSNKRGERRTEAADAGCFMTSVHHVTPTS